MDKFDWTQLETYYKECTNPSEQAVCKLLAAAGVPAEEVKENTLLAKDVLALDWVDKQRLPEIFLYAKQHGVGAQQARDELGFRLGDIYRVPVLKATYEYLVKRAQEGAVPADSAVREAILEDEFTAYRKAVNDIARSINEVPIEQRVNPTMLKTMFTRVYLGCPAS